MFLQVGKLKLNTKKKSLDPGNLDKKKMTTAREVVEYFFEYQKVCNLEYYIQRMFEAESLKLKLWYKSGTKEEE